MLRLNWCNVWICFVFSLRRFSVFWAKSFGGRPAPRLWRDVSSSVPEQIDLWSMSCSASRLAMFDLGVSGICLTHQSIIFHRWNNLLLCICIQLHIFSETHNMWSILFTYLILYKCFRILLTWSLLYIFVRSTTRYCIYNVEHEVKSARAVNAGGVGGMRLAYQAATAAESEACAARFRAYDIDEAGFRCRESKWWGWVKQQLKLVHVADSWDMMTYACSFTMFTSAYQHKNIAFAWIIRFAFTVGKLRFSFLYFRDRLDFITPFHWLRHLTLVGLLSCLWRPLRRKQSPFSQKRGTMEQNGANTGPARNQDWRGIFSARTCSTVLG